VRFSAIHIDGFGIFHDVSVERLASGLSLFLGDNEAGKSTLLEFIRTMLFGFPNRQLPYPPLRGGDPGGRLVVTTDAGEELTIARRAGKRGGTVTVSSPHSDRADEDTLRRLLAGSTRELYRNVYGFSLTELQTFDTLRDQGVSDAIYGAGAGTPLSALPQARKAIDDRLGELYRRSGQNPQINKKLAELERVKDALRLAVQDSSRYDECVRDLREVEGRICLGLQSLAQTRTELTRADTYVKLWSDWTELQEAEACLQGLPAGAERFPADGLTRLDALLPQIASHEDRLAALAESLAAERQASESLVVDRAILDRSPRIDALVAGRGRYEDALLKLPENQQKLRAIEAEIRNMLVRLGGDWTESKVLGFDRSLATRETIRQHERRLADAGEAVTRAEQDVAARQEEYRRAVDEERIAGETLKGFEHIEEPADEAAIQELQMRRGEFLRILTDLPVVEAEWNRLREQVDREIKGVSPAWGLDEVRRFDPSVQAQTKVQHFIARLEQARREGDAARTARAAHEEAFKAKQEEIVTVQERLEKAATSGVVSPQELTRRRDNVELLREELRKSEDASREASALEAVLRGKRQELARLTPVVHAGVSRALRRSMGISVAMIPVGVALGWALDKVAAGAVVAGAGLLVGAMLFVVLKSLRRGPAGPMVDPVGLRAAIEGEISQLDREVAEVRARLSVAGANVKALAGELGLPSVPSWEDLRAFQRAIEREAEALRERSYLESEIQRLGVELGRRREALASAEERLNAARLAEETVAGEWQAYLRELMLPIDMSPQTVGLVHGKVDAIHREVRTMSDLESRIERMRNAQASYMALGSRIPALAAHPEGMPAEFLNRVDRFLEHWRQRQESIRARDVARRVYQDKAEQVEAARRRLNESQERYDETKRAKEAVLSAWGQWLRDRGFDVGMSPSTAIEALQIVQTCVDQLAAHKGLTEEMNVLLRGIGEYEQDVGAVMTGLGRIEPAEGQYAAAVAGLERELAQAREIDGRKRAAERQIVFLSAQHKEASESLDACRRRLADLLQEGKADDVDAFRRKGNLFRRRNELHSVIEEKRANLRKISGEADVDELMTRLRGMTLDQLNAQRSALDLRCRESEAELDRLRDRKAELNKTIESMQSTDDIARLREKEEGLLAEIREYAIEWARYSIARMLLDEAQQVYEREQQPQVIKDASRFFATLTAGAYSSIVAPPGQKTVEVVTPKGEHKRAEQLSRGTAEQLYLAIRFGYIGHRARNGERLPVVMDDILVNFDPGRTARAAEAILELAKTHQVLFFTCHPESVKVLRNKAPAAPLYFLRDGELTEEGP